MAAWISTTIIVAHNVHHIPAFVFQDAHGTRQQHCHCVAGAEVTGMVRFFGTPCRLFYIRLDLVRLVVRLDATAYGKSKFTGLFFHRSIHSTVLLPHVRF